MTNPWPINHREDGRVELMCPHGVGHPSAALTVLAQRTRTIGPWILIHGCDGCCKEPEFRASEVQHIMGMTE